MKNDTTTTTAAPFIAGVEFTNLKGCSGHHELSSLVAIVAPNGSGKTAVKDAIQLAIAGSHPDFGKTGKALMGLASAPTLGVGIMLSNHQRVARSWAMDAKGSVKATADVPTDWPADDVAMAFNPATFIGLNDADRVATLLRLGGITTPTTTAVEALRDTLEAKATGASRVTITEMDPFSPKLTDPGTFLEAAEAELVESRKAHKRDITRLEAAVKGLEDAARGAEAPVKVEAAEVETAAMEGQKLAEEASRIAERHRAADRLRRRVAEIGDAVAWTPDDDAALVRLGDEVARLAKAEGDEAADKEALRRVLAEGPEPEEVEEANEVLATTEVAGPSLPKEDAASARAVLLQKCAAVETMLPRLRQDVDDIKGMMAMECCPTCAAAGSDLKERLKATLSPQLEVATEKVAEAEASLDTMGAKLKELAGVLEKWEATEKRHKAIAEAREVLARDERVEAEAKALRARIDARAEDMIDPATGTRPNRAELEAARTNLQDRFNRAKALKDLGEVPSADDVAALAKLAEETAANRDAHAAKLAGLKAQLQRWHEWGAQEGHATRMRKELETARTKLTEVESLVVLTREAAAAMAAAIAEPLATGLRYFTDGVLPGRVVVDAKLAIYLETADRGLRGFPALSGSEKAVVAFALAATLAAKTPLRIAVIDEASTMDSTRKVAFLERVSMAVADGVLAQGIVIDHAVRDFGDPWQILSL